MGIYFYIYSLVLHSIHYINHFSLYIMSVCALCRVGSSAGELFFQIHVTADLPSVMLCWGAWTKDKQLYFSHIAFQLDLHQAARGAGGGQEGKGRDGLYSPSKRRVQWDDPENKVCSGCLCGCRVEWVAV